MVLVKNIYLLTKNFPKFDGIINQIQRAAVSIPSNIAEGSSRSSDMEFARFLEIAIGSAYETETQLELSHELGFVDDIQYMKLLGDIQSIERRLNVFINTIRGPQPKASGQ